MSCELQEIQGKEKKSICLLFYRHATNFVISTHEHYYLSINYSNPTRKEYAFMAVQSGIFMIEY